MTEFSFRDNWLGLIVHQTTRRKKRRHPHCWGCRFNPRTRKGATTATWRFMYMARFQSTHPQGCDGLTAAQVAAALVSIHAPARVRRNRTYRIVRFFTFQSTHPQGCDRHLGRRPSPACRFNPRTRKGATSEPASWRARSRCVSIHAPARVRRYGMVRPARVRWFQSTHPQGCDPPPLNILNPGPEKADPREPHPEVMPRNAHAYFVEFNHLKCREHFSREPPGDSMGAWGSRVRRCGSAVASATGRGDLPGPAAPPVTQPASTGRDPAPAGPESRARWGLWRCCGRRTAW